MPMFSRDINTKHQTEEIESVPSTGEDVMGESKQRFLMILRKEATTVFTRHVEVLNLGVAM